MYSLRRSKQMLLYLAVTAMLIFGALSALQCSDVTSPSTAQENPVIKYSSITDLVKAVEPTVVRIEVSGTMFSVTGSGFIVDSRGYVVTNQHVINQSTSIVVTLMNGDAYNAHVVVSDVNRDVAILKLSSNRNDFPSVILGSSAGILTGEEILSAGFPLGEELLPGPATFGRGIVSAVRKIGDINYIQTDIITINPGSSGSPVMNMEGKVIGIVVAGVLPHGSDIEGISLIIPIDEAKSIIQGAITR